MSVKAVKNDVVAPRSEQPVQVSEWPGHTSMKFTTNKAHVPAPNVDNTQPHPLFSMAGRMHFPEKNDVQK